MYLALLFFFSFMSGLVVTLTVLLPEVITPNSTVDDYTILFLMTVLVGMFIGVAFHFAIEHYESKTAHRTEGIIIDFLPESNAIVVKSDNGDFVKIYVTAQEYYQHKLNATSSIVYFAVSGKITGQTEYKLKLNLI